MHHHGHPRRAAVLITLSVLAAVVLPGTPAGAAVAFDATFEDGTTRGFNQQESSSERITVGPVEGTGGGISGRAAAQIRCGAQDRGVAGSGSAWRTELAAGVADTAARLGTESWWDWSFHLGRGFPTPATSGDWLILSQFHAILSGASPVIAFEVQSSNTLQLVVRSGSVSSPTVRRVALMPTGSLARSRTYDIRTYVRWSTGSDGVVTVWVDGRQAAEVRGPNQYGGQQGGYLKLGCYRRASVAVPDGTLWFDDVRRATTAGALAAPAPAPAPTTPTTTPTAPAQPVAPAEAGRYLEVSARSDRSGAVPLAGATLAGPAHVFVDDPGVRSVTFSLDGVTARTEGEGPFDFEQSSAGRAVALRPLAAGPHTIGARIVLRDGRTVQETARFTLGGASAAPTTTTTAPRPTTTTTAPRPTTTVPAEVPAATSLLRVSSRADRSGARTLDGATLSGASHVFVDDASVRSVAFTLDGAPARTEGAAPFDFEQSGDRSATPLRRLSPGTHVIRATLTLRSGGTTTATATFRVS